MQEKQLNEWHNPNLFHHIISITKWLTRILTRTNIIEPESKIHRINFQTFQNYFLYLISLPISVSFLWKVLFEGNMES